MNIPSLKSDACKRKILRNLSRILDVRVLEVDVQGKIISFAYQSPMAFEKVKRELRSIGYPMENGYGGMDLPNWASHSQIRYVSRQKEPQMSHLVY